jgi:hypothetical protein
MSITSAIEICTAVVAVHGLVREISERHYLKKVEKRLRRWLREKLREQKKRVKGARTRRNRKLTETPQPLTPAEMPRPLTLNYPRSLEELEVPSKDPLPTQPLPSVLKDEWDEWD